MFHHSIKSGWEAALLTVAILLVSPLAQASAIQSQPPEKIFAAACSTCHGARGRGGDSWVNGVNAPRIAGLRMISDTAAKNMVRNGSDNRGMPGFGPAEITDTELNNLVSWFRNNCGMGMMGSCPAPARPSGTEAKVDILDADPWYTDKGVDNTNDPYDDVRRVVLGANQYMTLTNTGKTWHTLTNGAVSKDSGFIGYAGNLGSGTGYYYADQSTGLAAGCVRYQCKLHPYMQFEVCTSGNTPAAITKASKNPIAAPAVGGSGEVWVNTQSQHESAGDTVDGAMQVINASNWSIKNYVANVGNNPHNAWSGKDGSGNTVTLTANWHDNTATLIDGTTKTVLNTKPVGAAAAHVQVSPGAVERWFVTIMGGVAVQEVDVSKLRAGQDPNVGAPIRGEFSPHGIWFCDDGDHFLTANTLASTVSLYSANQKKQQSFVATGGKSPLATSVFSGYGTGGCTRAYSNNAGTASVSVYDINPTAGTIAHNTTAIPAAIRDASGNLKLRDTSIYPVRWVHMPIQAPVSPDDATTHGRYMVTANKASFNVSITALDSQGTPTAIYTFPSGLGAHGANFGRKALCDSGNPNDVCYYAYVTNTFENYISVFDLEKVAASGVPGSANETVHLDGYGAQALCGQASCDVAITTFCPDCRSGAHAGDVPLQTTVTGKYTYLKEEVWLDPLQTDVKLDLDLKIDTGAQGIMVAPAPRPWP